MNVTSIITDQNNDNKNNIIKTTIDNRKGNQITIRIINYNMD